MSKYINWTPIEFTEYYSPDGQVLKFNTLTRALISEAGFGMPPIDYIDQRGPLQHGKTVYDYRLQPRLIQIVFRENGCSRQEYWDIRANILNLLRPNRQLACEFGLGTLRKIYPDKTRRDIRVVIDQGPEFVARQANKWDEFSITETLRFIAPDPTFYDPVPILVNVNFGVAPEEPGGADLKFPVYFTSDNLIFGGFSGGGGSGMYSINTTYTGTWPTYPSFTLTGPLNDVVITNSTTGEVLSLVDYAIDYGETVTINLEYGGKSIVSDIKGSLLRYLASYSDFATFHIEPAPKAPDGVNSISLLCSYADENRSTAQMSYYTRYIGI